MQDHIQGKRIELMRATADIDTAAEMYFVIDKCREIFSPWLDWADETHSAEDTLKFLKIADKNWKNNTEFVYTILLDKKLIGLITAKEISWEDKRAEVAYWLDTDYTGNGYMSEAVALIEKALFANGFNRLVIHTDVLNTRSANVAIKAGYKFEGILRQNIYSELHKRFRDQNVFSKLKSELKVR